jgi:CRP-like cAMP-binding protein
MARRSSKPTNGNSGNWLLRALSPPDLRLIDSRLEPVQLKIKDELEAVNTPIEHVYFLEEGFASIVSVANGGREIEVGVVGREGVTGISVILGNGSSPNRTYIQVAGKGLRLKADHLREALDKSRTFRQLFLRFVHSFVSQTTHTASANGRALLEQRLARWILMADDRIDGHRLPLTHEFLGIMLGVRRAGVTVTIHLLEGRGLIHANRGEIHVLDRQGLKELAGSSYGVPEAELLRLLDKSPPSGS